MTSAINLADEKDLKATEDFVRQTLAMGGFGTETANLIWRDMRSFLEKTVYAPATMTLPPAAYETAEVQSVIAKFRQHLELVKINSTTTLLPLLVERHRRLDRD